MIQKPSTPDEFYQKAWRPFTAFVAAVSFGLVVIHLIALSFVGLLIGNMAIVAALPQIIGAYAALFATIFAVAGVAAHHRGREKRARYGEFDNGGMSQSIDTISDGMNSLTNSALKD